MRSVLTVLPVGIVMLFAGCVLMPEEPAEVSATPAAVFVEVPPPSPETELPSGGAALLVLPQAKPASWHSSSSAPAHALASSRKQDPRASKGPESGGAPTQGSPSVAMKAAGKNETAKSETAKSDAVAGPAWMKACQHRQQQGDVLMCDTDVLLAQPSDKVMVYVRDAKLSRKQAGGPGIVLRESLPRMYRIFVLD